MAVEDSNIGKHAVTHYEVFETIRLCNTSKI